MDRPLRLTAPPRDLRSTISAETRATRTGGATGWQPLIAKRRADADGHAAIACRQLRQHLVTRSNPEHSLAEERRARLQSRARTGGRDDTRASCRPRRAAPKSTQRAKCRPRRSGRQAACPAVHSRMSGREKRRAPAPPSGGSCSIPGKGTRKATRCGSRGSPLYPSGEQSPRAARRRVRVLAQRSPSALPLASRVGLYRRERKVPALIICNWLRARPGPNKPRERMLLTVRRCSLRKCMFVKWSESSIFPKLSSGRYRNPLPENRGAGAPISPGATPACNGRTCAAGSGALCEPRGLFDKSHRRRSQAEARIPR